ncbi:M20/M25/M40 family metallo-hydrolase [Candidatus Collierbacteria bacterium]|nr:M20/M25/M40 family metallo-hydrolase [Candidatus Collierbacteria bacterium]
MRTLLEQLIAIKSYSGEEIKLRDFIALWLKGKKIKSFVQDSNLMVHLKGKDSRMAFIFNSHMDTVSAGDVKLWKTDPWKATREGNKMIGLGASDMKAGLAASLLTCVAFSKNVPPVDLWFTFVVREEQDGSGSLDFAKWFKNEGHVKKYRRIGGIFTEPTGLSEIEHGHRGNIFLWARTQGDSGHASRPKDIAVHSVKKMVEFADILEKEVDKWSRKYRNKIFNPPSVGIFTSINAGVIAEKGQVEVESPNKFPASCSASFDIRTVPGFHEISLSKIKALAKKMGVEVGLLFPIAPCGYTDPQDKLVQVVKKLAKKVKLSVSQGSADMGFLSEVGVKTIIFGPGEKRQSHMVNEYCYPDQVEKAVVLYKQIVENWAK